LLLSNAEVDAAVEESGSTADNSTADGVLLGRAVAASCAGTAAAVAGLLKRLSNVDLWCSLIGFIGGNMLGDGSP
jgi:hypothetical protein